jgi:hypothetical protein
MRQDIREVIQRAREIVNEKNVLRVAIAFRRWHGQLTDLVWIGGSADDSIVFNSPFKRVSGILVVEHDGISFETIGNTTESQARAIIKGLMAASDFRQLKKAVW